MKTGRFQLRNHGILGFLNNRYFTLPHVIVISPLIIVTSPQETRDSHHKVGTLPVF